MLRSVKFAAAVCCWKIFVTGRLAAQIAAVSAATYKPVVAPGSLASIFGANLAESAQVAKPDSRCSLPVVLNGVRITVDGLEAGLSYLSPDQINFVIPALVSLGEKELVLQTAQGAATTRVNVASVAPGILMTSTGKALFTRRAHGDPDLVQFSELRDPAGKARLTIHATGLNLGRGQAAGVQVFAVAGGMTPLPLPVESADQHFCEPGIDRIQITLPEELVSSGSFELYLQAGETNSGPKTITLRAPQLPAVNELLQVGVRLELQPPAVRDKIGTVSVAAQSTREAGTDYVAGATSLTTAGRLTRVTAAGTIGQSSILNDDGTNLNYGSPNILIRLQPKGTISSTSGEVGRGTLNIIDTVSNRNLEIRGYAYGYGIFVSDGLLEYFLPRGMSIRSLNGSTVPILYIRDPNDVENSVYLRGNRQIGSQGTELKFGFGPLDDTPGAENNISNYDEHMRLIKNVGLAIPDGRILGIYGGLNYASLFGSIYKGGVDGTGGMSIAGVAGRPVSIYPGSSGTKALVIKGLAGQSGNLTEWQDGNGAIVASVSPTGNLTVAAPTAPSHASTKAYVDSQLGGGGGTDFVSGRSSLSTVGRATRVTAVGTIGQSAILSDDGSNLNYGSPNTLVRLQPRGTVSPTSGEIGRGTLNVIDTVSNRNLEIRGFAYGYGIFLSDGILEGFLPRGLSIRNLTGSAVPIFYVRDAADTENSVYIRGNRQIGSQGTELKFGFGPLDDTPGAENNVNNYDEHMRLIKNVGLAIPDGRILGIYGGPNYASLFGSIYKGGVDGTGGMSIAGVAGRPVSIYPGSSGTKALVIKGLAGQSGNLTEWQDGNGAIVASVSPTGNLTVAAPTAPSHAATKAYVDSKLGLLPAARNSPNSVQRDTRGSYGQNATIDITSILIPSGSDPGLTPALKLHREANARTLQLVDSNLQLAEGKEPQCKASNAGTLVRVAGTVGVADTVRICGKDASGMYGYKALVTF